MMDWLQRNLQRRLSRRQSLKSAGKLGISGAMAAAAGMVTPASAASGKAAKPHAGRHGGANRTVGRVDNERNGFDPHAILTDWDRGTVSTDDAGKRVRTFEIVAVDKEIEIAPGVFFPAWTYNGRVPGPTLRATEGEQIKVRFRNVGSHPHSIHFHGIHAASMDGIEGAGMVEPGDEFTYELSAKPFGCHLYHCHAIPLKRHIHKGLYGAIIIDPDPDLHPDHREVALSRKLGAPENAHWQEMVMVMNGFDTNFDDENEVYAANSIAFAYMLDPIEIDPKRPVRIYLVNVTEFDPINSFHLHANFFNYFDHGTTLTPTLQTVDTVMLCQAQRGIIEFSFEGFEPGRYMFHAHQAEFAELGWMSFFKVKA